MANPDPPGSAPGNAGWVRAFAESTAAQREPLADGAHRLPGLRPVYWQGEASEGFAGALHRLAGEWRTALAVHEGVADRVDGYSVFVHQLPHLWEADRDDPAELARLAEVHRTAVTELARELVRRAAELDTVAADPRPAPVADPRPVPDPAPAPVPDPGPAPEAAPGAVEHGDPDRAEESRQEVARDGSLQNGVAQVDPPTALADRLRHTEVLLGQLRSGERVHRIPLEHLAAG